MYIINNITWNLDQPWIICVNIWSVEKREKSNTVQRGLKNWSTVSQTNKEGISSSVHPFLPDTIKANYRKPAKHINGRSRNREREFNWVTDIFFITALFGSLRSNSQHNHYQRALEISFNFESNKTVADKHRTPSPHGGRGALPSEGGCPSDLLFLACGGAAESLFFLFYLY